MLTQQHGAIRRGLQLVLFVAALCMIPAGIAAQSSEQPSSFVGDVAKQVLLDPTTYAPAIIGYDATIRDWKTSQPFFRNGFMERNSRFTATGLPYGPPLSYSEGNRQIALDALTNLSSSILNNVVDRSVERMLLKAHPEHRKLIRTLGWVERISFGITMSYVLSAEHYRQAQLNTRLADQLGLK